MPAQRYEGEFALWGGGALIALGAIVAALPFGLNGPDFTFEDFTTLPAFPLSYGLATLGLAFVGYGVGTVLTTPARPSRSRR